MDPITAMAASGGAGLLGSILTNQSNAQQAQNQMNFQNYESSTAYQRQVADMKAAGLNPMFAIGSGGASTPSGAMATMQNPIQSGLASAQQANDMINASKNAETQRLGTISQIAKNTQDISTSKVAAEKMKTETQTEQGDVPAAQIKYQIYNKIKDLIKDRGTSVAPKAPLRGSWGQPMNQNIVPFPGQINP